MAKTKTQITDNINSKIITDGNIRAIDTKEILLDIMDYSEVNPVIPPPSQSDIKTFSFQSKGMLDDQNKNGKLSYSMRGIKDHFVNITFEIEIQGINVEQLRFTHLNKDLIPELENIIPRDKVNRIDFLVSIKNEENSFRVGNLNFTYDNRNILINIKGETIKNNLLKGDTITTSFTVHAPKR